MQDGVINISYEMAMIAERMRDLSYKVDNGRFKYSEKQELDRLLARYLELEKLKKEG